MTQCLSTCINCPWPEPQRTRGAAADYGSATTSDWFHRAFVAPLQQCSSERRRVGQQRVETRNVVLPGHRRSGGDGGETSSSSAAGRAAAAAVAATASSSPAADVTGSGSRDTRRGGQRRRAAAARARASPPRPRVAGLGAAACPAPGAARGDLGLIALGLVVGGGRQSIPERAAAGRGALHLDDVRWPRTPRRRRLAPTIASRRCWRRRRPRARTPS